MKKIIISTISILLVTLLAFSCFSITASANWISPLAERGDVNNDGVLQVNDSRTILRCAVKIVKLNPPKKWPSNKVYGDVDGDKKVTPADARIVLRRAIGLSDTTKIIYENDSEIFFSGKYYLISTIKENGLETSMEMAIDGSNFYTKANFDGMNMAFIIADGKIILINPDKKRYTQPSESELAQFGLDMEDFLSDFDFGSIAGAAPELVNTEENVMLDGVEYTCYTYENEDGSYSKHYRIDKKLCVVESYNTAGTLSSSMYIDSISEDVDKAFDLSSYSRTSLLMFMMGYASSIL